VIAKFDFFHIKVMATIFWYNFKSQLEVVFVNGNFFCNEIILMDSNLSVMINIFESAHSDIFEKKYSPIW